MQGLKHCLLLTLLVISASACAPTVTNFSPLFPKSEVQTQIFKNPKFDQLGYSTFTVQPISQFKEKPLLTNGIVEMQMMFIVRDLFESIGYLYVEPRQRSDLVITVDALCLQDTGYVPPQAFSVPKWVPEREVVTYGTMTGTYRSWPNYMSRGQISGTIVSKTYIPGYMTNETYIAPGYNYTENYSGVGLWIFDRTNSDLLFNGIAVGTANSPDIRVSSQLLLVQALKDFPRGSVPILRESFSSEFGFLYKVLTNSGNDFYPTVVDLNENAPRNLMRADMITSIDGIGTKNKTGREIYDIFQRTTSEFTMIIKRLNEELRITMSRKKR